MFFLNPGLMDCPFLPPPAQIASAGQLNKIKQTNGIPQSLSPLTVESWCKHQWKTVPHEYTELPSATMKSSGNNAANPEPQNNHLPTLWPEEKQVAYSVASCLLSSWSTVVARAMMLDENIYIDK